MASQLDADGDIDTDGGKVKPARKKSVSKATGAVDEKPKTPRKRAPKKQASGNANVEGNQDDSAEEKGGEVTKPTPKKRASKAKKVEIDGENNDADVEDGAEPATPKVTPAKKRTPKVKKESISGEAGPSVSSSSKKRASLGGAGDDEDGTPSKKPRATPSKAAGSKLPTSLAELKEEDKLMLEMKKEKKTWAEITTAYSGITGLQYGKSTLAVRYGKIMDALMEWKDGDVERMLFAKEMVDKENLEKIAAFNKKVENDTWYEVAKGMVKLGGDVYTAGAVEKAYNKEKKEGFSHRATVATVMAKYTSGTGISGGGDKGVEGDGEADEADEMKGLNLKEAEDMDTSADAEATEV